MSDDLKEMTDAELDQLQFDVLTEQSRRNNLEVIPVQMAALNTEYLVADGIEQNDAWRQPTGAHDAYPINWAVSHKNKKWLSLLDGNVWEPSVSGWREQGNDWPDWVQPTGAHDAYSLNAQVTHTSKHWVSKANGNVWEPGIAGSENLWTDAGASPEHPIEPPNEYPAWVQPTGASDDYDQGAKVSHNGKHWTSTANANVWEPGVYGWTEVV